MNEKILIVVGSHGVDVFQKDIDKALEKNGRGFTIHSAHTAAVMSAGIVLVSTIVLKPKES